MHLRGQSIVLIVNVDSLFKCSPASMEEIQQGCRERGVNEYAEGDGCSEQ